MEHPVILPTSLTKTQIDKLGDRLRDGGASEDDYLLLALYRESFGPAYREIVEIVQRAVRVPVTGRPGKTTPSIVAKLRRFRTRLSQIQDIAGCRVVVDDRLAQERALAWLVSAFPSATIVDRRAKPSQGYRAVHIIPVASGKAVEIQLRTKLQHLWAELSEALSFRFFEGLKYGDEVPDVASLPALVRLLRARVISELASQEDKDRLIRVLDDPDLRRQAILGLPEDQRKLLDEARETVVEIQRLLLEASEDIHTLETRIPGQATRDARSELEQSIQTLISSVQVVR